MRAWFICGCSGDEGRLNAKVRRDAEGSKRDQLVLSGVEAAALGAGEVVAWVGGEAREGVAAVRTEVVLGAVDAKAVAALEDVGGDGEEEEGDPEGELEASDADVAAEGDAGAGREACVKAGPVAIAGGRWAPFEGEHAGTQSEVEVWRTVFPSCPGDDGADVNRAEESGEGDADAGCGAELTPVHEGVSAGGASDCGECE
jgi:hypothetical protein